jgi:hypothetical protein
LETLAVSDWSGLPVANGAERVSAVVFDSEQAPISGWTWREGTPLQKGSRDLVAIALTGSAAANPTQPNRGNRR